MPTTAIKAFLRILGTVVLAVLILAVLGIGFAYSGAYNVAATGGHTRPLEQMLRIMMVRSVASHARKITPPVGFNGRDRAWAEKAAGHYEMMCRTCHGSPAKKPDPWQLYPPAPDLADALRVTRWTDPEVFWIIKNGIKDTAMSAFGASHDDDDLWALTAFIRQLGTITPEQYHAMVERAPMHDEHAHEQKSEEHESSPKKEEPAHEH